MKKRNKLTKKTNKNPLLLLLQMNSITIELGNDQIDPQAACLTSSQGTKSSVCVITSEPERGFHSDEMNIFDSTVLRSGPHPG